MPPTAPAIVSAAPDAVTLGGLKMSKPSRLRLVSMTVLLLAAAVCLWGALAFRVLSPFFEVHPGRCDVLAGSSRRFRYTDRAPKRQYRVFV
jgi:hypothetical protein